MRKKTQSTALLFMLQCLVTMLLAFPDAHAAVKDVTQKVNSYIEQGEPLDIIQELGLKRSLAQGDKILSLKIIAQASAQRSNLKVMANSEQVHRERMTDSMKTISIDLVGKDVSSLSVQGKALYIKKITATIDEYIAPRNPRRDGPQQNQDVIKARISQQLYAGDSIQVRRVLRQETGQNLKGMKIEKVVVKGQANSPRGIAALQLIVNGMAVGQVQRMDRYTNKVVFMLPSRQRNIVGKDITSIKVQVIRGKVLAQVLKVKIVPKRNSQGRANEIKVRVNETFRGRQNISLANMIVMNTRARVNTNAIVESVTMTISGRGVVKLGSNYSELGTMIPTPNGRTLTVQVYGQKSLRDIMVKLNGRVTVESVKVQIKQPRFRY